MQDVFPVKSGNNVMTRVFTWISCWRGDKKTSAN